MKIRVGTSTYRVDVTELGPASYRVVVDGASYEVSIHSGDEEDGAVPEKRGTDGTPWAIEEASPVLAPLPGKIVSIEVHAGESVTRDQPLVLLESMKMNVPVRSPRRGTVKKICVSVGQNLSVGQEMMVIE